MKWIDIIENEYWFYSEELKKFYKISEVDNLLEVNAASNILTGPKHLLPNPQMSFQKTHQGPRASILIFGCQDELPRTPPNSDMPTFSFARLNTSTRFSEEVSFQTTAQGLKYRYMSGFFSIPKDQEFVIFSKLALAVLKVDFENRRVIPLKLFATKMAQIQHCRLSQRGSHLFVVLDRAENEKNNTIPLKSRDHLSELDPAKFNSGRLDIKRAQLGERKVKLSLIKAKRYNNFYGCLILVDLLIDQQGAPRVRDCIDCERYHDCHFFEPLVGNVRDNIAVFVFAKGLDLKRIFYDVSRHRILKEEERALQVVVSDNSVSWDRAKVVRSLGDCADILTNESLLVRINSHA